MNPSISCSDYSSESCSSLEQQNSSLSQHSDQEMFQQFRMNCQFHSEPGSEIPLGHWEYLPVQLQIKERTQWKKKHQMLACNIHTHTQKVNNILHVQCHTFISGCNIIMYSLTSIDFSTLISVCCFIAQFQCGVIHHLPDPQEEWAWWWDTVECSSTFSMIDAVIIAWVLSCSITVGKWVGGNSG